MMRVIPTRYESDIIYSQTVKECTTEQTVYIPVDGLTSSFIIEVMGHKVVTTLYDPDCKLIFSNFIKCEESVR